MNQPSLFDALHRPPVYVAVDRTAPYVRVEPETRLILRHPRLAWNRAEIALHPHENLWMWATVWMLEDQGGGYAVGPSSGKFAETKDDALFHAIREIRLNIERHHCDASNAIRKWLGSLQ